MAKKRIAILNAATILFAEKGYNETSTAELAQITNCAEGTVFYHFKTKTDLFLEVLKEVKKGIAGEFQHYIGNRDFDNGLAMMEEVIAFFLYLSAHRSEWFMLLQRHHPYELALENEECRSYLEDIYNALLDMLESGILLGRKDGSIRETPSRETALIVFSMVYGLIWLKNHDLYETGTLYQGLLAACKRLLISEDH